MPRTVRWLVYALILLVSGAAVYWFKLVPLYENRARERSERKQREIQGPLPRASQDPALAPSAEVAAMLLETEDGAPLDSFDRDYYALFRHAASVDGEALHDKARFVDYKWFARAAPELRGQPARIEALYAEGEAIALKDVVSGRDIIYRVFLIDPSGDEVYVVDLLEPPAGFERLDLVAADAFFYRLVRYDAGKDRPKRVTAPHFIGRELLHLVRHQTPHQLQSQMLTIALVLLALFGVGIVVWIVRDSNRRRLRTLELELARGKFHGEQVAGGGAALSLGKATAGREGARAGTQQSAHGHVHTPPPPPPSPPEWTKRAAELSKHRTHGGATLRVDLAAKRNLVRWLVAGTAIALALFGYNAYRYLQDVREAARGGALADEARAKEAFTRATQAAERILEIEKRIAASGAGPTPQDIAELRPLAAELGESAEDQIAVLFAARARKETKGEPPNDALIQEHRQVKLWVLDAGDLIASTGEAELRATSPGYMVPLFRARARREAAAQTLAALEERAKRGETPAALAADAKAVRGELAQIEGELRRIYEYLQAGLVRDDVTRETFPELAPLFEEMAQGADATARLDALEMGGPR